MNDTDLATLVRDAVRDTHMTVPESDITRRARRLRTRRRVAAGGAMSAGLAATALAVAMFAAPASSPATGQQNTAQLTAWTVTKDPRGVIDVTIRELKDPAGLQARLRADGVSAIVSFSGPNPACDPYYPNYQYILPGYLLSVGNLNPGKPWIHSYDNGSVTVSVTSASDLTLVLRPARMPRGTAFQIMARPRFVIPVVAWGLVKTSPACTGLSASWYACGYRHIPGGTHRHMQPVAVLSGWRRNVCRLPLTPAAPAAARPGLIIDIPRIIAYGIYLHVGVSGENAPHRWPALDVEAAEAVPAAPRAARGPCLPVVPYGAIRAAYEDL